jgi:deazaflavin-dependent oxidoreductase (nitroreductase family)
MRRTSRIITVSAALGAVATGVVIVWRRNPRIGTTFVNSTIDPILLQRGFAGGESSEIGIIEHIGRKSGIRRLTPVYPEPTPEGFRIIVPLGPSSEWARNVAAAGHCRLQLHDDVFELDEPVLVPAGEVQSLPRVLRGILGTLGFDYLLLRTFDSRPGILEPVEIVAIEAEAAGSEPAATEASSVELVTATT